MKLRLIKEYRGPLGTKPVGTVIDYTPYNQLWQLMTEPERVQRGIFVHCFGHGDFDVYRLGEDVEIALDPKARRAEERKLDRLIKKLIKQNPDKTADELAEIVAELLKEEIVNGG